MQRHIQRTLILTGFVLLVAVSFSADAELGGSINSIDADKIHMKAQVRSPAIAAAAYTVHELTLPSNTVVRQYASASGIVFAVSWHGPFKPDLRQLLGPHFDTMLERQSHNVHAGHPHTRINEQNLVIESGGHMRNFVGRAYLPSQMPAGVTAQDIK